MGAEISEVERIIVEALDALEAGQPLAEVTEKLRLAGIVLARCECGTGSSSPKHSEYCPMSSDFKDLVKPEKKV